MPKEDLLWLSHRARASAGCAFLVSLWGGGLTADPGYALAHRHGWGLVDGPWVDALDPILPPGHVAPVTCRIKPVAGAGYPDPPTFLAKERPVRIEADRAPSDIGHWSAARRVICLDWIMSVARRMPDLHFSELTLSYLKRDGLWHLVDQRMPRPGASADGPGTWVEETALSLDVEKGPKQDPTVQAAELYWAITGPRMVPPDRLDVTMTKGPRRE